MSLSVDVNDQITTSISAIQASGGDQAMAVASDLLTGIAQSLASAKQGNATMDELSTSIENAEAALHEIIAGLINS